MSKRPSIDYIRSLQLLALEAIEMQDSDSFYRKVCRWYSKTFYTPLTTVEDMPTDQVLLTYYEETLSEMYEADDQDSKHMYEQYRKYILNPESAVQEGDEDEKWAIEEIEKMRKQADKNAKDKVAQVAEDAAKNIAAAVQTVIDKQAKSSESEPNIPSEGMLDLSNVAVQGEDPFFED